MTAVRIIFGATVIELVKARKEMKSKLHPSTCFPPNPSNPTLLNRLFIRHASTDNKRQPICLTLVGQNKYTYSIVAAFIATRRKTAIECIRLFDIEEQKQAQIILNDLQGMASMNRMNIRLECVQSYWQTKDSSIILIHVQHHRLINETIHGWMQRNAHLVEKIVSQICLYSPQATLIIGTEPNELMTYVAWRISNFPSERVFGLGASFKINTKCGSHVYWTKAIVMLRIVQAVLNGQNFQSNFAVNIGLIDPSQTVFLIYPTILGSTHRGIERLLPSPTNDQFIRQRSYLIPYEKLQRQIYLSKSKD